MSGAGGARLVVLPDLTVTVTDPRGRDATVVVDDHDGALRVRVARPADVGVLLASVPALRAGAGTADLASGRLRPAPDGLRWDQDVEVLLGARLLLRRRGGRWRPTPVAVVPLVVATVSVLAGAGVVLGVVALLAVRVGRLLPRGRPGGGATG